MAAADIFIRLGIALGLGLLVGLQRESVEEASAGIRTFALIALTGAIASLLSVDAGIWIVAAGFIALGALVIVGYVTNVQRGKEGTGVTTEVAALLINEHDRPLTRIGQKDGRFHHPLQHLLQVKRGRNRLTNAIKGI